jgi:hypothetical protein
MSHPAPTFTPTHYAQICWLLDHATAQDVATLPLVVQAWAQELRMRCGQSVPGGTEARGV